MLSALSFNDPVSLARRSVPDSDLLRYLPDLLDGLFGMIADPNRELRQAVHKALQVLCPSVRWQGSLPTIARHNSHHTSGNSADMG